VLKTHLVRLPAALVGALERRRAVVATAAAHKALLGSEAKFAKAFNANPSGMAITTLEGRVVDVNETFLRTLGYTRDEAIGRTTVELGLWRSQEERSHAVQETQQFGRVQQIEIEGRTKDNARRTLLYSAELIDLEDVPHVLVLTTDVTERRQLEDQLRQAGKMEAVGQLAGGVAHDFNNILTAILGYADLLAEGLPAADQRREDLEEIRKAAQRAAALTRQLLAFSRKQVLELRSLDVNLLVDNMDKMLRPLLGENIQLRAVPAPKLHAVRADPNQIEQVILNLAVNARDAMPKGGKLTIETANVDLDEHYAARHATVVPGPHVLLAVSDTGTGMDAATQARIFEPFFTTKDPGRGTGLGLATVYGIVKQSGGSIWVYSEPGVGTAFKIYLPRCDEPEAKRETPPVPLAVARTGSEAVLLVEDEAEVRRLVERLLRMQGYAVTAAASPAEAIAAARAAGKIDLLVTDVIMPGMNGREMARLLAAERPRMRVLYMSGYTDAAIAQQGILPPGTAFLSKPFTPDVLARKVREVLDAPEEN